MGKNNVLQPEDFGYRENRWFYHLVEHFGGSYATADLLGIHTPVTIIQWRDLGRVPPLRLPRVAAALNISPLALNHPVASQWWRFFFNQEPPLFEEVIAQEILNSAIMTEEEYEACIALPSAPVPRGVLKELGASE